MDDGDERMDEMLRTWGREQRAHADTETLAMPALADDSGRSPRRYGSVAAVVALVAAAAVVLGVLTTRHENSASPASTNQPTSSVTPSPSASSGPVVPPGRQSFTYHRLSILVPSSWKFNDTRCGTPQSNTVISPVGAVATCLALNSPRVTWVEFTETHGYQRPIVQAKTTAIRVDGHPATRTVGTPEGMPSYTLVRVVVPDALAGVDVYSPSASSARAIADTAAVVDESANGCPTEHAYRALTTVPRPSLPGAHTQLVPGNPVGAVICNYERGLLSTDLSVDVADTLATLRGLPPGFSLTADVGVAEKVCSDPDNLAVSVDQDRFDGTPPVEFLILLRYEHGETLTLTARLGICGYLGVTNGTVRGQDTMALLKLLFQVPTSAGYPEDVHPVR